MDPFPKLVGLSTALPPHLLRQAEAKEFASKVFSTLVNEETRDRLLSIFDHSEVTTRYLCVPLSKLNEKRTFFETNTQYIHLATKLGTEAISKLLDQVHLRPEEIDHFIFVSTTGIATPSIDAHIANGLKFRPDMKRTPLWGLGCLGGAGGLAHARDFALAYPKSRVLLLTLELCSLTFQRDDITKKNVVATSLFGDGAAAVLVLGSEAPLPPRRLLPPMEITASAGRFWPNTLTLMGWDIRDNGLYVILSPELPAFVGEEIAPDLENFLSQHGLASMNIPHFATHPGGVKVLSALADALALPETHFRYSREILRDFGNMSSPTCLFALQNILERGNLKPGESTVVTAMGPGFSSQYVLLKHR